MLLRPHRANAPQFRMIFDGMRERIVPANELRFAGRLQQDSSQPDVRFVEVWFF
jgi:hypothetical protein